MIRYVKEHLAVKVFLTTALLLLAVSGGIYGMIALGISHSYLLELNDSLNDQIEELLPRLEELSLGELGSVLDLFAMEHGLSMELESADGERLEGYGELAVMVAPDADSAMLQRSETISKRYFVVLRDQKRYQLLVFGGKEKSNAALEALENVLPMLGVITFFAALGISLFYTRYITRPVIRISGVSRKMSGLDFQARCPEGRTDELGMLGENLNMLSEHLEEALEELRDKNAILQKDIEREQQLEQQQLAFFSAVSHELKTPVTVLKGQIQGMIYGVGGYKDRDRYLRRSFEVVNSMEEMIQEILSVARIKSNGFSLNRTPVELSGLVARTAGELEDMIIDKGVELSMELPPSAEIYADQGLFAKVASNVIGNAVKYTPENGKIWIRVYTEDEDVCFSVENESPPIPEEELPRLFEAFYRCDKSRSRKAGGSGLGLYIVNMIVELHGFRCRFQNTERGVEMKIWCTRKTSA